MVERVGQRPRHSISWSPESSLKQLSSTFPSCNQGQHAFTIPQLTLLHRLIYFSWIHLVKKFQGQEPSYFQINLSPQCFPVMFWRKGEIWFVSDQVAQLTWDRSRILLLQLLPWVGHSVSQSFVQLSQWDGNSKGTCQLPAWAFLLVHYLPSSKASLILFSPRCFLQALTFHGWWHVSPLRFKVLVMYLWKSHTVLNITYICSQILGDSFAVSVSSFFGAWI